MKWTQAQKCWGSSKSGAEPGAGPKVGELPKSNACFNTWKLRPQTPFLHAISFHKDQLHWWQILISIHSNIILIIPSKVPFEGTLFLLEWLNHGVTIPWQALAFHQVARTQFRRRLVQNAYSSSNSQKSKLITTCIWNLLCELTSSFLHVICINCRSWLIPQCQMSFELKMPPVSPLLYQLNLESQGLSEGSTHHCRKATV